LAGQAARMRTKKNAHKILVGNREEKGPLGRPGHTWKDNVKIDLRDIMNFRVP
jgi:hypothetical protein